MVAPSTGGSGGISPDRGRSTTAPRNWAARHDLLLARPALCSASVGSGELVSSSGSRTQSGRDGFLVAMRRMKEMIR